MVKSAKESIRQQATNLEIYGKMQEVFIDLDKSHAVSILIHDLHKLLTIHF